MAAAPLRRALWRLVGRGRPPNEILALANLMASIRPVLSGSGQNVSARIG